MPLLFTSTRPGIALFACCLYWAWLARSARRHPLPEGVGRRVSDRLASLPLVDLAASGLFYSQVAFLHNGQDPIQDGWANVATGLAWMVPMLAFGLTLVLRRWIPQT